MDKYQQASTHEIQVPMVVGHGVDTWVWNVTYAGNIMDGDNYNRVERELDDELQDELNHLKAKAQWEEASVLTRWAFKGNPLFLREKGGGTFKWILECPSLTVAIARGKRNGIIAQVRLSSAYLWSCGWIGDAVSEVHCFLMDLFGEHIYLQVSEIHLCTDVVGWDVSRCDWQDSFVARASLDDQFPANVPSDGLIDGPDRVRRRWKRIETLNWSRHTSPISCSIYHKVEEIKIKSPTKVWFHDLWKQNGWDGEAPVWRIEFRFTRSFLRNLETPIESPYEMLSRLKDLWEYAAGHVNGGEDSLPDGWLRYVVATDDSNRSRWPVRPEWAMIQAAFDDQGIEDNGIGSIVRKRQREVNVERGVASVTGYLSTLAAWLYDLFTVDGVDVSLILHWLSEEVEHYLLKKERDFQEVVIKKRLVYELPLRAA